MKYSDVIGQEYSEKTGMVEIMGQTVQLCDHMELIDGRYYATAMAVDIRDQKLMSDAGVPSKRWPTKNDPEGDLYMFFSEVHLDQAAPVTSGDTQTAMMVKRLKAALEPLNRKSCNHAA